MGVAPDSAYQPEEPRGPTSHEAFNALYWSLGAYQAGRCSAEAVGEHFASARDELELIDGHVRREAALRPLTLEVERRLPHVYRLLLRIRSLLELLSEHLETGALEAAERSLARIAESYQQLDAGLEEILRYDQERPSFSESPLVDELIHTCYGFLEGSLGVEPVLWRIDQALEHFETRLGLLESAEPLPGETGILEESRQEVSETVERQLEALGGLRENTEDPEAFLVCLEDVRQTTDKLIALQQRLVRASRGPEPLACVSCGAENVVGDKVCGACGARLPQAVGVQPAGASLDVTIGAGTPAEQAPMTVNVQRLLTAVESARHGAQDGALAQEIEAMRKRVEESRVRLNTLAEPDSRTPPDQLTLFHTTRQRLDAGMTEFEEALDELARFLQDENLLHLEAGSARLMEAQAALLALQSRAQEVLERARRAG